MTVGYAATFGRRCLALLLVRRMRGYQVLAAREMVVCVCLVATRATLLDRL
jgi:hypothetical protein